MGSDLFSIFVTQPHIDQIMRQGEKKKVRESLKETDRNEVIEAAG